MNERDFVDKKRTDWAHLSNLVQKANRIGTKRLSRSEIQEIGILYRRTASDLAKASARGLNDDLVVHLNELTARSYSLLYEQSEDRDPAKSVLEFYMWEFPALLQKRFLYFFTSVLVGVIGAVFAYWLVIHQPEKLNLFIPDQLRSSVEAWKSGHVSGSAQAEQSSLLMAHNFQVGMISFAAGVFGGFPSMEFMFSNGTMLGAMSALMTQVHQHQNFWPGIVPHGIAELTAIFICGAAGLLTGISILLPGRQTRAESFISGSLDAIKLVLGTIPLFVFAGIIEGMFSHLPIPAWFRYLFAVLNGLLWYLYLFIPRRGFSRGSEHYIIVGQDRSGVRIV